MEANNIKKRDLLLKDVPDDIFKIIVEEQARIKVQKKSGQFGLAQVVYKMLRERNREQKDDQVHS